jgi:hypothetical protein
MMSAVRVLWSRFQRKTSRLFISTRLLRSPRPSSVAVRLCTPSSSGLRDALHPSTSKHPARAHPAAKGRGKKPNLPVFNRRTIKRLRELASASLYPLLCGSILFSLMLSISIRLDSLVPSSYTPNISVTLLSLWY